MDAALVILDGWGLDGPGRNAVSAADTPTFDRFLATGASGTLDVSGRRVGLPDGQMGNSEVGHLNIGAGRVVTQPLARIHDAIDDGSFFENDALRGAVDHVRATGGRLHLLGLVSDGGVHSHQRHLHALIELAARHDVDHIAIGGHGDDPSGLLERLLGTVATTVVAEAPITVTVVRERADVGVEDGDGDSAGGSANAGGGTDADGDH